MSAIPIMRFGNVLIHYIELREVDLSETLLHWFMLLFVACCLLGNGWWVYNRLNYIITNILIYHAFGLCIPNAGYNMVVSMNVVGAGVEVEG